MKIGELFPRKYASGEDMHGQPVTVTIDRVVMETMSPSGQGAPVDKPVLWAKGASKAVILNRTLAYQIAEIVGSDDTDKWPGHRVTLFPVPMQVAGRAVVAIRARRPGNAVQDEPAALQDQEEGEG